MPGLSFAFVGGCLNFIICFDVKLILFMRDSKIRFLKVFLCLLESTFITVVVYKLFSEEWVIKPKHRLLVCRVSNNVIPRGKFSRNLKSNITADMQMGMLRFAQYGPCWLLVCGLNYSPLSRTSVCVIVVLAKGLGHR